MWTASEVYFHWLSICNIVVPSRVAPPGSGISSVASFLQDTIPLDGSVLPREEIVMECYRGNYEQIGGEVRFRVPEEMQPPPLISGEKLFSRGFLTIVLHADCGVYLVLLRSSTPGLPTFVKQTFRCSCSMSLKIFHGEPYRQKKATLSI